MTKDHHDPPTRVLVLEYLSAGGRLGDAAADAELLALGRSMRDALAADLAVLPGVIATVALQPGEPAPAAALRGVVAPPALPLAVWLDDAQQGFDAIWVVAPESDGLLAAMQAVVTPSRWIGCDAAAIAVSSSKRATLAAMARAGVPTPLAFEHEAAAWVVKPDDGAGAIDTRRHASRGAAAADLQRRAAAGASAVLEPWVEGEPLSLALLCVDGGTRVIARNRQRIELDDDGTVHYRGVEVGAIAGGDARAPELDAMARRVTAALPGLRGVIGIDLVWHPRHGPVLIELNPRPTCAYGGLSAAAGFNVAAAVLADHLVRSDVARTGGGRCRRLSCCSAGTWAVPTSRSRASSVPPTARCCCAMRCSGPARCGSASTACSRRWPTRSGAGPICARPPTR